jgi:hypothetical protein
LTVHDQPIPTGRYLVKRRPALEGSNDLGRAQPVLPIEPSDANGLKTPSQVMVGKIVAMPRDKCGRVMGRITDSERGALNHMLSVVIGIAD